MALAAMSTARGALNGLTNNDAYQAGQALGDAAFDAAEDRLGLGADPDDPDDRFQVVDDKGHVIETTTTEEWAAGEGLSQASIMGAVRVIGGGMIGIAVLVIVLNEMFSLQSISNTSGPFTSVIDSLETTGGAALGLLVIGFLVLAANRIMGFFGGGGF